MHTLRHVCACANASAAYGVPARASFHPAPVAASGEPAAEPQEQPEPAWSANPHNTATLTLRQAARAVGVTLPGERWMPPAGAMRRPLALSDRTPADYFREVDGHPVPFTGTPGSGKVAIGKAAASGKTEGMKPKAPEAPKPDADGVLHKTPNGKLWASSSGDDASIEYKMGEGPLAGKYLQNGAPATSPAGEPVVRFSGNVMVRTAGRPELAELAAKHGEVVGKLKARADWEPEGTEAIRDAHEDHKREYRKQQKFIANDLLGKQPREKESAEKLAALRAAHPEAAVWHDAEQQEERSHWSDPTGTSEAAEAAKEVLRNGGSAEEAKVALVKRRTADYRD